MRNLHRSKYKVYDNVTGECVFTEHTINKIREWFFLHQDPTIMYTVYCVPVIGERKYEGLYVYTEKQGWYVIHHEF